MNRQQMDHFIGEIDRQAAEIERLRADAARYQYVRSLWLKDGQITSLEHADNLIDKTMAEDAAQQK